MAGEHTAPSGAFAWRQREGSHASRRDSGEDDVGSKTNATKLEGEQRGRATLVAGACLGQAQAALSLRGAGGMRERRKGAGGLPEQKHGREVRGGRDACRRERAMRLRCGGFWGRRLDGGLCQVHGAMVQAVAAAASGQIAAEGGGRERKQLSQGRDPRGGDQQKHGKNASQVSTVALARRLVQRGCGRRSAPALRARRGSGGRRR